MTKKFCCENFEGYFEGGKFFEGGKLVSEHYPAIYIVKIAPFQKIEFKHDKLLPYRFLFVCGFLKDKPPFINMRYCPFCGTDLPKFYKSDEYINEDEKTFFS